MLIASILITNSYRGFEKKKKEKNIIIDWFSDIQGRMIPNYLRNTSEFVGSAKQQTRTIHSPENVQVIVRYKTCLFNRFHAYYSSSYATIFSAIVQHILNIHCDQFRQPAKMIN